MGDLLWKQDVLRAWGLPFSTTLTIVESGVDNHTYSVQSPSARYALTLLRNTSAQHVNLIYPILQRLHQVNINVPLPKTCVDDNQYIVKINNSDAILCRWLYGETLVQPNEEQCFDLGCLLAKVHTQSKVTEGLKRSIFSEITDYALNNLQFMHNQAIDLMEWGISVWQDIDESKLNYGFCHADLFRDNVLFQGNKVSGIIDFNSAANTYHIYDLATVVLDFCYQDDIKCFSEPLIASLLNGYNSVNAQPVLSHYLMNATAFVGVCVMMKRYDRKQQNISLPADRLPNEMEQRIVALEKQKLATKF